MAPVPEVGGVGSGGGRAGGRDAERAPARAQGVGRGRGPWGAQEAALRGVARGGGGGGGGRAYICHGERPDGRLTHILDPAVQTVRVGLAAAGVEVRLSLLYILTTIL